MIEAGIAMLLVAEPTLQAIVRNRVYMLRFPEGVAMPALKFMNIGGESAPTFDTSGPQTVRMQFDCYGQNMMDAVTLRDALIRFLNGYRGVLPNGVFLQGTRLIQSMDFDESQSQEVRLMAEFYLYFNFPN